MSDELEAAIAKANAFLSLAPIPAPLKAALGFAGMAVTRVDEMRMAARGARVAELARHGIKLKGDPFDITMNRRLERAQADERRRTEAAALSGVRGRIDALDAGKPTGPGFKVPKASMAWEGVLPAERVSGQQLTEDPNPPTGGPLGEAG